MAEAVTAGGGMVTPLAEAQALVWGSPAKPAALAEVLEQAPHLEWVQLPWAGIEPYIDVIDDERLWTCAKGVYAEPVAELALALGLAGLRGLATFGRATRWQRTRGHEPSRRTGHDPRRRGHHRGPAQVARALRRARDRGAQPGASRWTAPTSSSRVSTSTTRFPVPTSSWSPSPSRPTPRGSSGETSCASWSAHAWLVNVARGRHVVTEDLVKALEAGEIGGAALDVTEPEPLPDGHPLWTTANCIITPHVGNTPEMAKPLLAERITTNVRRFAHGEQLIGPVDLELGY